MPLASGHRFALLATLTALAFCLVIKLPTLKYPISNWDELIYWELTKQWLQTGEYSLQGNALLEKLPRSFYDHPAFNHPPGFPALLAPFVLGQSPRFAVVLSWAGHALAILAVALVGWELLLASAETVTFRLRCVFFLPLLALAADPVLNFIARKIWMDNLLAGASALALVFTWLATRRSSPILPAIAAGLFAALACSLKITAAIVLPAMAVVLVFSGRRSWRAAVWTLVPAMVVLLAWMAWFHHQTGSWLPWWMKPDEAFLRSNPFVAASVGQSPFFYVWQLLVCCPFAVVLIVSAPWNRLSWRSGVGRMSVLWILLVLAAFTFIGLGGYPKETRYIAPAIPAVYWLFYTRYQAEDGPSADQNDRVFVFFLLAVLAGAMLSGYYLLIGQYDEIVSPLKLLGG